VEKKYDALTKDHTNDCAMCARTDTMEVSVSSNSTITDQWSVGVARTYHESISQFQFYYNTPTECGSE